MCLKYLVLPLWILEGVTSWGRLIDVNFCAKYAIIPGNEAYLIGEMDLNVEFDLLWLIVCLNDEESGPLNEFAYLLCTAHA